MPNLAGAPGRCCGFRCLPECERQQQAPMLCCLALSHQACLPSREEALLLHKRRSKNQHY